MDPLPLPIVDKTLKYAERDEHLLRRLAGALVLHWDHVPDALQDTILAQAALVEDRTEATQDEIESFVRRVKAVAIRRSSPEAP